MYSLFIKSALSVKRSSSTGSDPKSAEVYWNLSIDVRGLWDQAYCDKFLLRLIL